MPEYINDNILTASGDFDSDFRSDVLAKYSTINKNCIFSRRRIVTIRESLEQKLRNEKQTETSVVAFGSYARLDASELSDLDYLIVTRDRQLSHDRWQHHVKDVIEASGIPLPNQQGVFQGVVSFDELCSDIGGKSDGYDQLSRRLLHVLESRSLWGDEAYQRNIGDLLELYGADVSGDSRKNYVFLLNDLIRYFRTVCVNYAHTKSAEPTKWPIRNLKLRHSRVVMYVSLVAMLGVLSVYRGQDKNDKLRELIRLTPLERLFYAYRETGDTGFYKVAGCYDVFLRFLNTRKTRATLRGLVYEERYQNDDFSVLKATSDALAAELTRFIFDRRGVWSDRFYEYLLL